MKAVVITFPGSNCDSDALRGLKSNGFDAKFVWHKESAIDEKIDLIIVPGGFSYGDYLRSGAMAAISPVMNEVKRLSQKGVNVLGICNGFQILTEAKLLEGALLKNRLEKFICRDVSIKTQNNSTKFTSKLKKDQVIKIPVAHMDGRYFADDKTISSLNDEGRVVFRYCDENGVISDESNINGSISSIAGIINKQGNVLGMMPHPERASDGLLGLTDGSAIFASLKSI